MTSFFLLFKNFRFLEYKQKTLVLAQEHYFRLIASIYTLESTFHLA